MVSWTDSAKRDLKKIYEYIVIDSPYYARKVILSIIQKTFTFDKHFEQFGFDIVPK